MTPPYDEKSPASKDWSTKLSTVLLEDKLLLSPGGFGTDASGFLKREYTFKSPDWETSIDLEVAEVEGGANSYAGFNMYFLAEQPSFEYGLKDYARFARGLPTNEIRGAWVSIRQSDEEENVLADNNSKTLFTIELKLYGSDHTLLNEPMHTRCQVSFNRAILRLFSEEKTSRFLLEVLPEGAEEWVPCFETNSTAINYKVYSYITTGGVEAHRKAHYIHSVKMYDNEPDEVETPDESKEEEKPKTGDVVVVETVPRANDAVLLQLYN